MLETIGAKTGDQRWAMLGYVEESPESWPVIASLAGAARHPAWLHNLAQRSEAKIEFGDGRRLDVRAESLEGEQLQRAAIGQEAPEYVSCRSKTDREIRLRPR